MLYVYHSALGEIGAAPDFVLHRFRFVPLTSKNVKRLNLVLATCTRLLAQSSCSSLDIGKVYEAFLIGLSLRGTSAIPCRLVDVAMLGL